MQNHFPRSRISGKCDSECVSTFTPKVCALQATTVSEFCEAIYKSFLTHVWTVSKDVVHIHSNLAACILNMFFHTWQVFARQQ